MNRSVFCGNLAPLATEPILYELFLQVGPVDAITLRHAKVTEPRYAFVTFRHPESVDYAITILAGTRLFGQVLQLRHPVTNARPFGRYPRHYRITLSEQLRVVYVYSGEQMRRIREAAGLGQSLRYHYPPLEGRRLADVAKTLTDKNTMEATKMDTSAGGETSRVDMAEVNVDGQLAALTKKLTLQEEADAMANCGETSGQYGNRANGRGWRWPWYQRGDRADYVIPRLRGARNT